MLTYAQKYRLRRFLILWGFRGVETSFPDMPEMREYANYLLSNRGWLNRPMREDERAFEEAETERVWASPCASCGSDACDGSCDPSVAAD